MYCKIGEIIFESECFKNSIKILENTVPKIFKIKISILYPFNFG